MSGTVRPPPGHPAALSDPNIVPARSQPGVSPSVTAMTRLGDMAGSPSSESGELPLVCPTCGTRYPGDFNVCPKDATTLVGSAGEQLVDDLVGSVLRDTYKIIRVVGEGGMGRVYEARHVRIKNKRFAVKTLHPEYARHEEVLARFSREAEASATIKSPNVMQVFDVDETPDGRPFMVGEFLEGRELADYLTDVKKLSVAKAVRITRQICAGLTAAHALGIVHRDMKPENVYLTGNLDAPVAKIIDFGISKAADATGSNLTKTGMIMGTPSFMAPEQARGDKVTHLCDVYATGAILYTLVTGKRPFDKPDATATLTAVLLEEPARPRSIDPNIPEGLEAIIQHAMAKNPNDRFASLADLDRELAAYDDGGVQPMGHTMLASSASLALTPARSGGRDVEASSARPLFTLLAVLGGFFVVGGLLTLVSSIARIARGSTLDANLTGTEAAVIVLLLIVALAAPVALVTLHLRRAVWGNTARVLEMVRRWRWPVVVGLAAYGTGSLLVRVIETVLLRRAAGAAWPVWDLFMIVVAGAAVVATVLGTRDARA
jgi:serine/threonine protein kinase